MALILFWELKVGRKAKTHKQFVAEMATLNADVEVLGEYVTRYTKLKFRCLIDGHTWEARPSTALSGSGCPKCAWNVKKTQGEFISEIAAKHPNIDVLGEYANNKSKIMVRCKLDGHEWSPTPNSLLQGQGCPECGGTKKKTHKQFVDALAKVNQNIEVIGEYVNNRSKIMVRCKLDGHEWSPTPNSLLSNALLSNKGCPKCYGNITKSHSEFVLELANTSPSIVVLNEYVNNRSKIRVGCLVDGHEWSTTPQRLLRGSRCPLCAGVSTKTNKRFVAEMAAKHPYIEVFGTYINNYTKIKVRCKLDGYEWSPTPSTLLSGSGCPKCAKYGYDSSKRGYFYSYAFDGYLGFGITNTPTVRHNEHLRTFKKLGIEATLMQTFSGDGKTIQDFETYLKQTLPIVNTGVEGFKTEAILWGDRELLFKACEEFQRSHSLKT